ncbi:hypothetical protein LOTGIDRAFT_231217 [Lottia gigantea]|uniref:ZP domain-containing protein n=1 Tax=Lottia gigantea TaxID=225164 RepID=V4AV76_LOTGI|nr:hypothetical protein LOTGIDRAFT_231217 [Lottia gigantea]ESO98865.1 hypothetical protein LOTGIDRAFT_231217 [Lottia gigantea]
MLRTGIFLILMLACFMSVFGRFLSTDCQYMDPTTGKKYDLRPLISSNPAGYTWNQTIWSIGGYSLDSLSNDVQVNVSFQLQLCKDIQPIFKGCNSTGAAYSYDMKNGCINWGQATAAAFDVVPFKDGVFLQMFHGDKINHWQKYMSNIYIVCDKTVTQPMPMFEHIKSDISQAHFKIRTKLMC